MQISDTARVSVIEVRVADERGTTIPMRTTRRNRYPVMRNAVEKNAARYASLAIRERTAGRQTESCRRQKRLGAVAGVVVIVVAVVAVVVVVEQPRFGSVSYIASGNREL